MTHKTQKEAANKLAMRTISTERLPRVNIRCLTSKDPSRGTDRRGPRSRAGPDIPRCRQRFCQAPWSWRNSRSGCRHKPAINKP
jgi:hypothetical protein